MTTSSLPMYTATPKAIRLAERTRELDLPSHTPPLTHSHEAAGLTRVIDRVLQKLGRLDEVWRQEREGDGVREHGSWPEQGRVAGRTHLCSWP